nr:hypothetical protein 2 - Aedes densovirus (strain GKV 002 002) [Aedes aegypti densovirus]
MAICIGSMRVGGRLINLFCICAFIVYLSSLCWILFFNIYSFILCSICDVSFISMLFVIGVAVVIHVGVRSIGSLSLFFTSVFMVFPSSNNFHVPTFTGVIIGSSNRIDPAPGTWSRWNPLLSLSRGISSGFTMANKLSNINDFPAFVIPSSTIPFIFLYLFVFIISFHARKWMILMLFSLNKYSIHSIHFAVLLLSSPGVKCFIYSSFNISSIISVSVFAFINCCIRVLSMRTILVT